MHIQYNPCPLKFSPPGRLQLAGDCRMTYEIYADRLKNIDLLGIKLNIKQLHSSYVKGCESYLEEI